MRHFARKGLGAWQQANSYARKRPPKALHSWLFDSGSLTAKLQRRSCGELNVEILRQTHSRASLSECSALNIPPHSYCLVREVVLRGPNNTPWVFARSVFPVLSLTGRLRHLKMMGNKPLGAYLFSRPELKRSPMQIAALTEGIPAALKSEAVLWGRRSIFTLFNRQILVSEIFLPDLIHEQK